MSCNLGPISLQFLALRFLPKREGQRPEDLDELSGQEIVDRYLVESCLVTPACSYSLMPSPVALFREVLNALPGIAQRSGALIYLVEDCEFSLSIEPTAVPSDLLSVSLRGPGSVFLSWRESPARLVFELSAVLHAVQACLHGSAQVTMEELLSRCPAEAAWHCETDA